jgi:pimeloyl-ACP methyl ester carboxylesterase
LSIAGQLAALLLGLAGGAAMAQGLPDAPAPEPPAAPARAAVSSLYVSLGHLGQGLLWAPQNRNQDATAAGTAVVLVHPFASSLGNPLCSGLAERGFVVLCADPPNTNRPFRFNGYDVQAQTISEAIARARRERGVRSVILAGHGEGGALAAFYQNVAKNGPGACQGSGKISPCDGARLSGLVPAAGLVLVDPDLGQAFSTLSGLDPAIAVESAPTQRYPGLDMYDPRNGFDPGQNAGRYPAAFRKAFFAAQAERSARLTGEARKLVSAVATRERDAFSDDMPLFVAGVLTTPLWQVDAGLLVRTKRAHKLLSADGSTPTRILESIALPTGNPREATSFRTAVAFSARRFLAGHAIETTADYDVTADDITGVVWASATTSAIPNIAGVTDPLLVVANTAHFGVRPTEMILDAAASQDKSLVGVEGAMHWFNPCQSCSGGSGRRFGDTMARAFDYIADWLRKRA